MNETLLIAHASSPRLTLIDAATLQPMGEILTPGRTAVLGTSSDGRYGFAIHRDDDCITLIDGANGASRTIQTEAEPTHFHAYAGQVVVFNDGAGSVSIFDEAALDQPPRVVKATQPDHGSAVVIDGYLLAGHLRLGQVDVYRIADGQWVQSFDCCPVLHGAAQIGQTAAFGCNDGVLLIRKIGDTFDGIKLDNPPDAPRRARVGIFALHPSQPLLLGNSGAGLALIDVAQAIIRILPLPAHPLKFTFDRSGAAILTLTHEGTLYGLDPTSGKIVASVSVTQPVEIPKGPTGGPHPTFAIGDDAIYVAAPDEQRLTVIDASFSIGQTLSLNDQPNAVVCLRA
ncbi:MAG TPA: hypothetical protein VHD90_22460 [Phototrophicaceae bacterium]|nr:hypothetical protein [Phototrophicaceae bacterium]